MTTEQWTYEYLPFTSNQTGEEIPNFRINFADGDKDGYVAETDANLPVEEQERHARLIAAAPDMYSELAEYERIIAEYIDQPDDIQSLAFDEIIVVYRQRKALAKAEGRE